MYGFWSLTCHSRGLQEIYTCYLAIDLVESVTEYIFITSLVIDRFRKVKLPDALVLSWGDLQDDSLNPSYQHHELLIL